MSTAPTTAPTTTTTPVCDMTTEDFGNSLTGFEELAVIDTFGKSVGLLNQLGSGLGFRALLMVHHMRTVGGKAKAAHDYAMGLPLAEVMAYFAADTEPEIDPEDPDTEAGKDGSPSDGPPRS